MHISQKIFFRLYLAEDWASDPVQRALVPLEPVRDEEAEDEGEAEDEQVAGGVEVDELRFDTKKCTINIHIHGVAGLGGGHST